MTTSGGESLAAAVAEYRGRRDGTRRPHGHYRAGREAWYPVASERRECCKPHLHRNPLAIRRHLQGVEHVANLYGIDQEALRRALTRPM